MYIKQFLLNPLQRWDWLVFSKGLFSQIFPQVDTQIFGCVVSKYNFVDHICSARDWERSGLLEENPQSGCSDICAFLKGPL